LLKVAGFFISPAKLVLFNSFGGKRYDDSPRAVFEAMRDDPRFAGWRFVWAFHEPSRFTVEGAQCIRTDSMQYFLTALRARIWITNSGIERGLSFKSRHTLYVNTWHGSTMKKMGNDIPQDNESFRTRGRMSDDIMLAQSEEQADIFSRVFVIPRSHFRIYGLPRNDRLCHVTAADCMAARERLGLPADRRVILYAPTFREYDRDDTGCIMRPPLDLARWDHELSSQYVLLFRAHYEVAHVLGVTDSDFVHNVTDYPVLDDLMLASDLLISDYSSIFYDYSLLGRPMLHYCYDYEKYDAERGLYFDIRQYLDGSETETGLLELLSHFDKKREQQRLRDFRKRFALADGEATPRLLDEIYSRIDKRSRK